MTEREAANKCLRCTISNDEPFCDTCAFWDEDRKEEGEEDGDNLRNQRQDQVFL